MRHILTIAAAFMLSGCGVYEGLGNTFGKDKVSHAGGGILVASIAEAAGATDDEACMWAIGVGIANEVRDAQGFGVADPMDAIATGLLGCIFSYSFDF